MTISRRIALSALSAMMIVFQSGIAMSCYADDVPSAATERITEGSDYIALLPGYSMPSKAYGTTGTGATISGIFGRQFASKFSVEINVQSSAFETGTSGGTDFYQTGGTIDLTYAPWDRRSARFVTPFVLAGMGGVYDDFFPNTRDGAAYIAEAGIGLVTRPIFSNGIRFRADARYIHDGKEGGHGEGRLLAGVEIPLGRVIHEIEYRQAQVEQPAPAGQDPIRRVESYAVAR